MYNHFSPTRKTSSLIALVALAVSLAIFAPASAQTSTPIPPCNGAPPSHLVIGQLARVTPGTPDNVRSKPSTSGEIVTQIAPGDIAFVIGEPTCAEGFLWWHVYTGNGFDGWMAEGSGSTYFLTPTTTGAAYYLAGSADQPLKIVYGKVSLSYPPGLAKVLGPDVTAATVLAYGGTSDTPFGSNPNYIKFTLGKVDPTKFYNLPTLSIYKVDAINKLGSDQQSLLAMVIDFLKSQPDLTQAKQIPVYPPQMAGQILHAQAKYVTFQSGTFVRFVAHDAQDVEPITGDNLSYFAVGLSSDGAYYLVLTMPITTAVLNGNDKAMPDQNAPNVGDLYQAYIAQTTQKLNKAAPADFAPSLDDLDTLLQSITLSDVKAS